MSNLYYFCQTFLMRHFVFDTCSRPFYIVLLDRHLHSVSNSKHHICLCESYVMFTISPTFVYVNLMSFYSSFFFARNNWLRKLLKCTILKENKFFSLIKIKKYETNIYNDALKIGKRNTNKKRRNKHLLWCIKNWKKKKNTCHWLI